MKKLIISGIVAGVVIGGLLAFMPFFEAAAASITIDRANTNRDGTVMTVKASLVEIPLGNLEVKVCVIVNGIEVTCDTKPVNTP